MMIIAGIDPGLSGAVALLRPDGLMTIDMPVFSLERNGKTKREIDVQSLARIFREHQVDHAWLEQVGAMPGQGVSSMFAFGQTFGIIKGVLAALQIPFTLVTPRAWKAEMKVPAAKDGARARASQLLPGYAACWPLVKHDGRAEAALIAFYGARYSTGEATNAL